MVGKKWTKKKDCSPYLNIKDMQKGRNLCASKVRMNVNRKCFLVSSWPNSVSAFSTFACT